MKKGYNVWEQTRHFKPPATPVVTLYGKFELNRRRKPARCKIERSKEIPQYAIAFGKGGGVQTMKKRGRT